MRKLAKALTGLPYWVLEHKSNAACLAWVYAGAIGSMLIAVFVAGCLGGAARHGVAVWAVLALVWAVLAVCTAGKRQW